MSTVPHLRVVAHPAREQRASLSVSMTLSEFYRRCFVPLWIEARRLAPMTRSSYDESIAWWVRLTGDPPLAEIDDFVAAEFAAGLASERGRRGRPMALYTANKHCKQVQRVLDFAGPRARDRASRRNLGLLDDTPWIERPRLERKAPCGDFSIDEIRAMYTAAVSMATPQLDGVCPTAWWRALIVAAAKTGLRIGQLLALRWEDMADDAGLPGAWIRVPASAHRCRRGLRQYLPREVVTHIERIRTDRELIFAWHSDGRFLQRQRIRLQKLALLPPHRRFGFHGFRRWNLTSIRVLGATRSRELAQAAAGHADQRTTMEHYINATVEEELLARALEALPSIAEEDPDERSDTDTSP